MLPLCEAYRIIQDKTQIEERGGEGQLGFIYIASLCVNFDCILLLICILEGFFFVVESEDGWWAWDKFEEQL